MRELNDKRTRRPVMLSRYRFQPRGRFHGDGGPSGSEGSTFSLAPLLELDPEIVDVRAALLECATQKSSGLCVQRRSESLSVVFASQTSSILPAKPPER
jgi:hypothetical protein